MITLAYPLKPSTLQPRSQAVQTAETIEQLLESTCQRIAFCSERRLIAEAHDKGAAEDGLSTLRANSYRCDLVRGRDNGFYIEAWF